ncbi:MAG: ribosome silencing factor [Chitinivibrionia bacterium]|nr:ribosome silencing factor [Chitinivibrionia bacterium]
MDIKNNEELNAAIKILKDSKAEDIVVIKTDLETVGTEYVIVCKGTAFVHVSAIAQNLKDRLKVENGIAPLVYEGREHGRWVLVDYPFATVHVMLQELRDYYKIEELHKDCERLEIK